MFTLKNTVTQGRTLLQTHSNGVSTSYDGQITQTQLSRWIESILRWLN